MHRLLPGASRPCGAFGTSGGPAPTALTVRLILPVAARCGVFGTSGEPAPTAFAAVLS